MSNENTEIVQVLKNQNNSNELFTIWNTKNQTNIKCAKNDCDNDVMDNAYIVNKNHYNQKKFIVPLCTKCYEQENNTINQTTEIFNDLGTFISVDKDLLLEYTL